MNLNLKKVLISGNLSMSNNLFQFTLRGMSMYPTFKDQDIISCSFDIDHIDIGDILVFKDSTTSEYTCHRVVKLSPLQTKGDNSICMDNLQDFTPLGKVVGANSREWNKSGQPYKYLISFISRNFMNEGMLRKPAKALLIFLTKICA